MQVEGSCKIVYDVKNRPPHHVALVSFTLFFGLALICEVRAVVESEGRLLKGSPLERQAQVFNLDSRRSESIDEDEHFKTTVGDVPLIKETAEVPGAGGSPPRPHGARRGLRAVGSPRPNPFTRGLRSPP
ncbi:hypothetical protein CYMTET_21104 [Cymbomonas tetramitiformis]|uniref:Transmembrane protein n=1 Tax=Cymbomonas tetramitiformis TaxID=36881 RepID=A0AAE0G416_9CHLO|nr:hypothetical protein CYMTET_21104 [Cymbomonas tetramitiformis]